MAWYDGLIGGVKEFGSGLANLFTGGNALSDGAFDAALLNPMSKVVGDTLVTASPEGGEILQYFGKDGNLYNSAFDAGGGLLGGAANLGKQAFGGLAGLGSGLGGSGASGALGDIGAIAPIAKMGFDAYGAMKAGDRADEVLGMQKDAYNRKVATRDRNQALINRVAEETKGL